MKMLSQEMQRCVHQCLSCYQACFSTAMNHCLEEGGAHTEPRHFRLMIECAEICRMTAHLMLMNAEHHSHFCAECAAICEECATSCRKLDGMDMCVESCSQCAESCRQMAVAMENTKPMEQQTDLRH